MVMGLIPTGCMFVMNLILTTSPPPPPYSRGWADSKAQRHGYNQCF